MIIRPVFNILLLPDITYFFKRDFFPGAAADQIEVGTDILFPFLKNEVDETTVTIDDIYPVGMSARVESIGDDDSIQIRTLERVSLDDIELDENGQITATASIRPEVDDLPLEEEKQTFTNLRNSLLKFVQNYQWGIWARSYIIQRKNIYDLGSALSDYLNITSEEKYAIVETDSRRERCELIENAIKEFMEVAKVSSEAQEAQKGDQEQLYREAAIKKQIDYRTQKHCRMKIMSTSMCCFSCWTGKCFTAFLRHRKSIHICTQEKNLTAISKHCRNSLSAFNRIQTILFQLIHHISFRLRKFKSCLCILMNVSSVCYCLVF